MNEGCWHVCRAVKSGNVELSSSPCHLPAVRSEYLQKVYLFGNTFRKQKAVAKSHSHLLAHALFDHSATMMYSMEHSVRPPCRCVVWSCTRYITNEAVDENTSGVQNHSAVLHVMSTAAAQTHQYADYGQVVTRQASSIQQLQLVLRGRSMLQIL